MFLRIETIPEKTLIGLHQTMTLADNKTHALWNGFMRRRDEIAHVVGREKYSVQVFDFASFQNFTPETPFEKWATVEVSSTETIPPSMEILTIPAGTYAVFLHKGAAETAQKSFQFIFGEWLPSSKYSLDDRPHFEVLGDRYKNDDPTSEEEIWIPVR